MDYHAFVLWREKLHPMWMKCEGVHPRLFRLAWSHCTRRITARLDENRQTGGDPLVAVNYRPNIPGWIYVTGRGKQVRVLFAGISTRNDRSETMSKNIAIDRHAVHFEGYAAAADQIIPIAIEIQRPANDPEKHWRQSKKDSHLLHVCF